MEPTRRVFLFAKWEKEKDWNLVLVDALVNFGCMSYLFGRFLFLPEYYGDDPTIWHDLKQVESSTVSSGHQVLLYSIVILLDQCSSYFSLSLF
jgi:hypothetical protein